MKAFTGRNVNDIDIMKDVCDSCGKDVSDTGFNLINGEYALHLSCILLLDLARIKKLIQKR